MADLIQRNFAGGEVSPAIYGRADVVKYQTGLLQCRNFVVRRHGGLENRTGSEMITAQGNHALQGRLIKFIFNASQTYVLLFEHLAMRVIQNGFLLTVTPDAWISTTGTMTGATKANPCVITAAAHGFVNGAQVIITGVVGMTQLNGNIYIVANAAANTFELFEIDSTTYGAWTSGGTVTRYYSIAEVVSRLSINYYCILAHSAHQPPNATYWYVMPADGTYEIPTPYTSDALPALYRSQSADVITLTNASYQIMDLSRTGHTTWTLSPVSMSPSIDAPTGLTNDKVAGTLTQWVVTAVKAETFEESVPSASTGATTAPTAAVPITLTFALVAEASEYNVYRNEGSGIYGFIGASSGPTFKDAGLAPNYDLTPPAARDPFSASTDHPACSGYLQQRKCYGGVASAPETLFGSKTGQYKNFSISAPIRDDDAVTYSIASSEVNTIRHILEVLESFILTSGTEWVARGNADGDLTPSSPGLKPHSFYGASTVPPVLVGDNIIYAQARGNLVRDLNYDVSAKGYTGRDLSVFAPHLFQGKVIVRMDFAQIPNSIVWLVQDDGALLGLTYLREHEVWGWHHHDTDGYYEDVCVVPEGTEDAVYVLVNRTINGATRRYVERFASRFVTDVTTESKFMDSFLTYDGRNLDEAITLTLSGGTDWLYTETLTLTAVGGSVFLTTDVGNAIRFSGLVLVWTPEGGHVTTVEHLIVTITGYTSPTVATGRAEKTVPVEFRNITTPAWAKGVDQLSGLDHLEGKSAAIIADGNVITNGIDAPLTTVTAGSFTLARPGFVIHAGLPYCSDMQTLDVELIGAETLAVRRKSITQVTLLVEATRGIWAGNDADHLFEHKQRSGEAYGQALELLTEKVTVSIAASWNSNGRIFVRQRDPLPLTILNATPVVELGG